MDIKRVIKSHGETITNVARALGITQSALTLQIQNNSLTTKKLEIIANHLGISVSALVADECDTPNTLTCPKCGAKLNVSITSEK